MNTLPSGLMPSYSFLFPIKLLFLGNSRNTTFETMIKTNTKGKGVDVVLNSLADELFQASMRCLAERGRFLEIGKVDLTNSSPIPSKMFLRNISFHGIHLDGLFFLDADVKKEIQYLVAEGIICCLNLWELSLLHSPISMILSC